MPENNCDSSNFARVARLLILIIVWSYILVYHPATNGIALSNPGGSEKNNYVSAGEFIKIYDPSGGEQEQWYINDHTIVRDESGVWHLFGITHVEPANALDEKSFAHATAPSLAGPWEKQPFAFSADEKYGETLLWAPYVMRHDDKYYMFYCAGSPDHSKYRIHLATSTDLFAWERAPENPLFEDGFDARDPFVLKTDRGWIMYYTATENPGGGHHIVACRKSDDLVNWSERRTCYKDPTIGTFGGPTESPFVVKHGDHYYLFIGPRPGYVGTDVFRSESPLKWKPADLAGHIESHAAELIHDPDTGWHVTHAGWGQDGVFLAPLLWND